MVGLGGQALETDVVIVVFAFGHVRHLEILLCDCEWVVASSHREVEVALRSSNTREHHGRGLKVN